MRKDRAKSWLIKSTMVAPFACTPAMLYAPGMRTRRVRFHHRQRRDDHGSRGSHRDRHRHRHARQRHRCADSSSPVQVLSDRSIESAGKPDLMNALANIVPSFTAQAFGGDMANQTLQAKLRGLTPNHTLVLVNGKRRHTTSSLAILGGPYQGGAGVDLNFIPSIRSITSKCSPKVRRRSTARMPSPASSTSSMKKNSDGGNVSLLARRPLRGRWRDRRVLGQRRPRGQSGSYINLVGRVSRARAHQSRRHRSARGGSDAHRSGAGRHVPQHEHAFAAGYPYLNQIFGDAAYEMKLVSLNAGIPIGDNAEIYSFGTWGDKHAASFENYRLPSRVVVHRSGHRGGDVLASIRLRSARGDRGDRLFRHARRQGRDR